MSYGPHTRNPYDDDHAEYEMVHCDGCDRLIIDGAPENGRIGREYVCPKCYGEKLAALQAVTVDYHDEVRR